MVGRRSCDRAGPGRRALWLVVVALAVGLSLPACASASAVYASNHGSSTISPFSIGAGGALTPIACGVSCDTGSGPVGTVASPDGRFLYTANFGAASVSAFAIGTDGIPTPIACASCGAGSEPFGAAASPNGRFLYVTNFGSASVSAFSIAGDGSLAQVSCGGGGCATGLGPEGVAIAPSGRFLYVTNDASDSVSVFALAADGSPTSVACTAGCGTGPSPVGVSISPDGRFLYVADSGSASVSVFSIAADGSLSPVTCAGASCATGSDPEATALSPDGRFLYAINRGSSSVSVFAIAADGSLSPVACPGTGCATGPEPEGAAISPDGTLLYTINHSSTVSAFAVAADGSLTPVACTASDCATGSGPDFQALTITPDQAPVASFTATPAPAGQRSVFDGAASSASSGQRVARYDWSFGDGASAIDAGPSPTHSYAAPGVYTVSLTVTDDAGCATQQTFTGQTVSCNGSAVARVSRQITISRAAVPAPELTRVHESARSWREHMRTKSRVPVGTTVAFTLSQPATVSFRFTRKAAGRAVSGRCVARTERNRHDARCARVIPVATLTFDAHRGTSRTRLTGRLSPTRELRPGRYELVITARNAAGRAAPRSLGFTIVA